MLLGSLMSPGSISSCRGTGGSLQSHSYVTATHSQVVEHARNQKPTATMAQMCPKPDFWLEGRCSLTQRKGGAITRVTGWKKAMKNDIWFLHNLAVKPLSCWCFCFLSFCLHLELKQVPAERRSQLLQGSAPMAPHTPGLRQGNPSQHLPHGQSNIRHHPMKQETSLTLCIISPLLSLKVTHSVPLGVEKNSDHQSLLCLFSSFHNSL